MYRKNKKALKDKVRYLHQDEAIKKALLAYSFNKYTREVNYYYYLQKKDQFRGSLRVLFPVSPTVTRIHNYTNWKRLNEAGMSNSGLLIFQSGNSHY